MVSTLQFGTNLWPVGTDSVHLKWAGLPINQKCTLVPNCLDRDVSRNPIGEFAQVVLPDPPAGHHNLALHFFDHDGREAERILFHHIPLFHPYGALPNLLNKGSCYAVIQSWKAGARIVTVSEEDQSIVSCMFIWLHMASSCCCSMAWNLVSVFDFRVLALSPRVCLGVLQEGHQSQNGGKQSGLVLRKSSV